MPEDAYSVANRLKYLQKQASMTPWGSQRHQEVMTMVANHAMQHAERITLCCAFLDGVSDEQLAAWVNEPGIRRLENLVLSAAGSITDNDEAAALVHTFGFETATDVALREDEADNV